MIVRMGADEFVLIATGVRDTNAAGTIASRIREKLGATFEVDGQEITVTSSVGVSVYPEHGADYEVLLKNADIALYESKDGGRDTHRVFARSMNTRVNERLTIEHRFLRGFRFLPRALVAHCSHRVHCRVDALDAIDARFEQLHR